MNLHCHLFQKQKGKEFEMLRINTLSPCSSLSRQQPSNPLQMHTSVTILNYQKKIIENGTNEIHAPGYGKKMEVNKQGKLVISILSGKVFLCDAHFITLLETCTFQDTLLSSSYAFQ